MVTAFGCATSQGSTVHNEALRQRSPGGCYLQLQAFPDSLGDSIELAAKPDGPWHPPEGVSSHCTPADSCSALSNKLGLLKKTIESHESFDAQYSPGRHDIEIQDLKNALQNCIAIHQRKCVNQPENVPVAEPAPETPPNPGIIVPLVIVGGVIIVCLACTACCAVAIPAL